MDHPFPLMLKGESDTTISEEETSQLEVKKINLGDVVEGFINSKGEECW